MQSTITAELHNAAFALQMVADDGTQFDVTLPEFTLSMPRVLH